MFHKSTLQIEFIFSNSFSKIKYIFCAASYYFGIVINCTECTFHENITTVYYIDLNICACTYVIHTLYNIIGLLTIIHLFTF